MNMIDIFKELGEYFGHKRNSENYCPECDCTVHKDEWEVSFVGNNEFIHCPECNYREQINGMIR